MPTPACATGTGGGEIRAEGRGQPVLGWSWRPRSRSSRSQAPRTAHWRAGGLRRCTRPFPTVRICSKCSALISRWEPGSELPHEGPRIELTCPPSDICVESTAENALACPRVSCAFLRLCLPSVVHTPGDLAGGRTCPVFRKAQLAEEKAGLTKERTDVSELRWLPVESGSTPHASVTWR